jgi:hypothetical protein
MTFGCSMLIDPFAPHPDAAEIHTIEIAAPPEAVYRALRTTNFADSFVIRCLLALRALPRLFKRRRRAATRLHTLTLDTVLQGSFGVLAEDPGREIVIGVTGRFWRPIDNTSPFNEQHFRDAVRPGFARAIWNFAVREGRNGRTILSTETRVVCGDRSSRRMFRVYWLVVRPFSGLIRILMLRAVRKRAMDPVER